ncbi:hypothetical protein HPP92_017609 [Vanilla planifolia]|uniref:Succinate dehydrogenase subunit 3 n=1 Tax=Vanilla planifolia TaxID=51239 RepID=A0A835QJS4_VANPL|nr:hypothetical protein HPP92_017609 [Vanilla planifolia]
MDTPFGLQGFVDGTKLNGKSRLPRIPSNIELLVKQNSLPHGSRAFHGSLPVSESTKGAYLNRPLSPHLPLKKPQLSATYSISHRIFGAALASAILLVPLSMKFSTLLYA